MIGPLIDVRALFLFFFIVVSFSSVSGEENWDDFEDVECSTHSDAKTFWVAAPIIAGENALDRGRYEDAYQYFLEGVQCETGWSDDSMYYLGLMNFNGQGTERDQVEALRWWRLGAEKNNPRAQFSIGMLYYQGVIVPQSYYETESWLQKSAKLGLAEAQHELGRMYFLGEGVTQNYIFAHMWFNIAATRYLSSQIEERNRAMEARSTVAKTMTPEEIAA